MFYPVREQFEFLEWRKDFVSTALMLGNFSGFRFRPHHWRTT